MDLHKTKIILFAYIAKLVRCRSKPNPIFETSNEINKPPLFYELHPIVRHDLTIGVQFILEWGLFYLPRLTDQFNLRNLQPIRSVVALNL